MSEANQGEQEQTFLSHLMELRQRLLRSSAAVLVIFLLLLPFSNRVFTGLAQPLLERLPMGGQLIATEVASPFFIPIKLVFFGALLMAMPFILYQAWAFVSPGLYRYEKRLALPLLISSIILFYVGCAFAYFFAMPTVFGFLSATTPQGVAMMTDISHYLDFVLAMFLSFGFCFEIPVATVIIVVLGWVTPEQLLKNRPYVFLGVFVVAAILAPPDVISQILLALPMYVLYELGILAARLLARGDNPLSFS